MKHDWPFLAARVDLVPDDTDLRNAPTKKLAGAYAILGNACTVSTEGDTQAGEGVRAPHEIGPTPQPPSFEVLQPRKDEISRLELMNEARLPDVLQQRCRRSRATIHSFSRQIGTTMRPLGSESPEAARPTPETGIRFETRTSGPGKKLSASASQPSQRGYQPSTT